MKNLNSLLRAAAAFAILVLMTPGAYALSFSALPSPAQLEQFLEYADTNDDGVLTFEEVQAAVPFVTQEMFDQLDRNGDGVLSLADIPPGADPQGPGLNNPIHRILEMLALADANDDGYLSMEEIQAFLPGFPEGLFEQLDQNGDGLLSLDDLPSAGVLFDQLIELLKLADANDDQQVTYDELAAVLPILREEWFDWLDRNNDGVLTVNDLPTPEPDDIIARLLRLMYEADANRDGQLTLAEIQAVYPGFPQTAFDYLDRNADGVLSREDIPHPLPDPREVLLRLFRAADADDNGEVTFDELAAIVWFLTPAQFDRLDRNDDGVISADDLPSFPPTPLERLIALLRHADANGDGQVTFEELQALVPGLTQEQFDALDRNGDGIISAADAPDKPRDILEKLIRALRAADADQNGEVTFEELQAVVPEVTQEQFNLLDRNGDGIISAEDLPDRPRDPRQLLLDWLRDADTDGNGELTFDELQAVLSGLTQEQFDVLDRNDDGVLTLEDLPDTPIPLLAHLRRQLFQFLSNMDENGDGLLDFNEIALVFPDAPAELLEAIDTNDDWAISRAELVAALGHAADGSKLIAIHDLDGNGATNALDLQNVINQALGIRTLLLLGDVNGDGQVNAADVQFIILGALGLE